jgi:hypothetical protein
VDKVKKKFKILIQTLVVTLLLLASVEIIYKHKETHNNTQIITSLFFFKKTVKYPVKVSFINVSNVSKTPIGISTVTYELDYGILPPGTGATKLIKLRNKNEIPAKVSLKVYGNVTQFLEFGKNNFILEENSSRDVYIRASSSEVGNYSGTLEVVVKKPLHRWLVWLLPFI